MLGLVQKLSDSARISAGLNDHMYWKKPWSQTLVPVNHQDVLAHSNSHGKERPSQQYFHCYDMMIFTFNHTRHVT